MFYSTDPLTYSNFLYFINSGNLEFTFGRCLFLHKAPMLFYWLNDRGNRGGNQEWTIQRHRQDKKQNEIKKHKTKMMNSTGLSKKSRVNLYVQKNEVSVSYMTPIVFLIVKSDKRLNEVSASYMTPIVFLIVKSDKCLVVDVGKKNKTASKSKDVLGICLYTQNDFEKLFRPNHILLKY
jgi:hypothetical protein